MKGQAFISLPSESRAKRALREVHGYVLHGKPMVIVSFCEESGKGLSGKQYFIQGLRSLQLLANKTVVFMSI